MSELLQQAIVQISKLPEEQQDELATWILEKLNSPDLKTEEEWEEEVLTEVLGDALNPDGSINFDKLRERGTIMTLEEFFPEGKSSDEF
jgi:hypothetical protein